MCRRDVKGVNHGERVRDGLGRRSLELATGDLQLSGAQRRRIADGERAGLDPGAAGVGVGGVDLRRSGALLIQSPTARDRIGERERVAAIDGQDTIVED